MKAIVIGATGATGKYLIQELIEDVTYQEVVALVRRPSFEPHPKLKEVIIDFNQIEKYTAEINGDVAFSVMGTTLKDAGSKEAQWKVDYDYQYHFAKLCSEQNVPTFVLLSAIGVDPKSSIFYNRMKGELEQAIQQLNFEQLLIFQPAALQRPQSDRFGEKLMTAIFSTLNGLGLLKKYQSIHVKDLAKALVKASKIPGNGIKTFKVQSIVQLYEA